MSTPDDFTFFRYTKAAFLVKIHNTREWARAIFLYVPREIWSRTEHGEGHSTRVLSYLKDLLDIFQITERAPNEVELFVLESSAWLHDIGYILPPPNLHALRSQELIKRFGRKYFSLESGERRVISWMCRAHSHNYPLQNVPTSHRLHGETVRTQKLAALFALADSCDACSRRAPKIVFEILKSDLEAMYPESIPHWKANQSVEGVYFSTDDGVVYLNVLNYRYPGMIKENLQQELDRCIAVLDDSFLLRHVRCLLISFPH